MSFPGLHVPIRLVRFFSLALCFALVFSAMPVSLKHGNPNAQGTGTGGQKRTLPPYYKLPNLNSLISEGKKLERPSLPRPALKPSTICGYRDKACQVKLGKEKKVGQNFAPSNDNDSYHIAGSVQKNDGNWFGRLGRVFSNTFARTSGLASTGSSFLAADSNRAAGHSANFNKTAAAASLLTPPGFPSLTDAKLDPRYRTGGAGEDLFSGNYNFSLPLVSLPGRAGLDLNLTLSYNSLPWIKFAATMYFDYDYYPTLTPGFRLGFPEIEGPYFAHNENVYIVYLPSGRRVEMQKVATNRFQAIDSSYLFLNINASDPTQMTLLSTDGTQYKFEIPPGGDYKPRCTQIRDSNGNYISIAYKNIGDPEYPLTVIDKVIDTLGRELFFNYDGALHLLNITQNWNGQTFIWAQFDYGTVYVNPNFGSLTVDGPRNIQIPVITRIVTGDGARHTFAYNPWGQAHTVSKYGEADNLRSQVVYAFPGTGSPLSDCPRFTQRNDIVFAWPGEVYNPGTQLGAATTYFYFEPNESFGQVTGPDAVSHREIFSTSGGTRGLTTRTETHYNGQIQQFTDITWLSNSTTSPPLRPRVTDTKVCDDRNHNGTYDNGTDKLRRTKIEYGSYASVWLPEIVREYNEGGESVYRTTVTSYIAGSNYTGNTRRIIGLPSITSLYEGDYSTLIAQTEFIYDSPNEGGTTFLQAHSSTPRQHDSANYGTGFLYRGNLTKSRRYSVVNGTAGSFTETKIGYYVTGTPALARDGMDHLTTISYDDSFRHYTEPSSGTLNVTPVTPNPPTYAYPTKMTDPDGYFSTVSYNYDFGAVTRKADPKAYAANPQDPQTMGVSTYDSKGRLDKALIWKDGTKHSQMRYVYGNDHNYVQTWATVNSLSEETAVLHMLDGVGRERVVVNEHPGSQGLLSSTYQVFDKMGRISEWSRPTEICSFCTGDAAWAPYGDDPEYFYNRQVYDWKGRPTVSTNPDLTTQITEYNGCGCAGSDVIETQGEQVAHDGTSGRRKTRTYRDVFGRESKTEALNWNGGVDSTKVVTYNTRDQITFVRVFQGASPTSDDGATCPTGACQKSEMVYDGYGRLDKQYRPIYKGNSSNPNPTPFDQYEYNADDTVKKMIDPRGVVKNYSYNNRKLLNGIAYTVPTGVQATPSVSFDYDATGNRTWMETAGLTRVDYTYDSLNRLETETRSFTAVNFPPSHIMSYGYNLAGQIKFVNSGGRIVTYDYDKTGQLISVTGNGYLHSSLMSEAKYRAWGAPKHYLYGGGGSFDFTYDSRMQVLQQNIAQSRVTNYSYYEDGGLKQILNQNDAEKRYSYEYDHIGRLSKVKSGGAVTGASTPTGPYQQAYGYDAFGHLNHRESKAWEDSTINTSTTYINDRNQSLPFGYSYDRVGNQLDDPSYITLNNGERLYQYDAEGRKRFVPQADNSATKYYYDGDGSLIKINNLFFFTATPLGGEPTTVYAERNNGPAFRVRDYVYADGKMIAGQYDEIFPILLFKYTDTTARLAVYYDGYVRENLFDPLGNPADRPAPEPIIVSPYENSGAGGGYQSLTCFLDGFITDCSVVAAILAGGAGSIGPRESSRYNRSSERWEFPMVAPSGRIAWFNSQGEIGRGLRVYQNNPNGTLTLLQEIAPVPESIFEAAGGFNYFTAYAQQKKKRQTLTEKYGYQDQVADGKKNDEEKLREAVLNAQDILANNFECNDFLSTSVNYAGFVPLPGENAAVLLNYFSSKNLIRKGWAFGGVALAFPGRSGIKLGKPFFDQYVGGLVFTFGLKVKEARTLTILHEIGHATGKFAHGLVIPYYMPGKSISTDQLDRGIIDKCIAPKKSMVPQP